MASAVHARQANTVACGETVAGQPRYDAHYLALAEMMEGEFRTADERLYNAVRDDFPNIRWLGDYQ
jgi:predicted nucleic acid-binding protein